MVEHIVDWRPFDYFTTSVELPGVGPMRLTTELAAGSGETTVHLRGEPLAGERLPAWETISDFLLAAVDTSLQSLSKHLSRVAIEA